MWHKDFLRCVLAQNRSSDKSGIPKKNPRALLAFPPKWSLLTKGLDPRVRPLPVARGINQYRLHDVNARPSPQQHQVALTDYRIKRHDTPKQIQAASTTVGQNVPHLLDWYNWAKPQQLCYQRDLSHTSPNG